MADRNSPLSVEIVDGVLTITVGVELLATGAVQCQDLAQFHEESGAYRQPRVLDVDGFARDVLTALMAEGEDGTTHVHVMLDAGVAGAIEDGSMEVLLPDDPEYDRA